MTESVSRGGWKKGGRHFVPLFWRENWNFYDPKIEICKINYCKNKVKLNSKDNNKNNVNEDKEII